MQKRISIFGATGSIGTTALDLLRDRKEEYAIEVLTAQSNVDGLAAVAHEFRPRLVVIGDEALYDGLRAQMPEGVEIAAGAKAVEHAAGLPVDICLNAIIGAAGLPVSLAAAKAASRLALANKESLVCGGALLIHACKANGCGLLPVDSEHSAIFQCLGGQDRTALKRVILTASGGAFRDWSIEQMQGATLQDALVHPNWDMGARITIDSASMFNKALEMIEAQVLFALDPAQIEVLIHPQSIVHSLVEFVDKGLLAQLGAPDMTHPIAYALSYPNRIKTGGERLDLAQIGNLTFEKPDHERFPAFDIARAVMSAGGAYPLVMNAAKEVALDRFMNSEIGFLDMAMIVGEVLENRPWPTHLSEVDEVFALDQAARQIAQTAQARFAKKG